MLEPIFHKDSFGYRPNRLALDAVALARKRCWQYDWVIKFDIKGEKQAEYVLKRLGERFCECGLELHPDKTKIVYCKDENRTERYQNIQFTFWDIHLGKKKSR